MNTVLKEFFTYSKRERRGVLCLIIMNFICLLVLAYNNEIFPPPKENIEIKNVKFEFENKKDSIGVDSLFEFNPNEIEKKKWMKLGLSAKQAAVLIKYRNAIGGFDNKSQILSAYTIDTPFYNKIEPYIELQRGDTSTKKRATKKTEPRKKRTSRKININAADTNDLKSIRGIGSVYANRILKYRYLLGGYANKEQLKEVYGLRDSLVLFLSKKIRIDRSEIRKVNLNNSEFKELIRHPYIDKKLTIKILNIKEKYGEFEKKEELLKYDLLNDGLYSKLVPYLEI